MRYRSLFITLSSLVLLAGCGKEVGRVPFTGDGSGSAPLELQAGDVDFWTDISIEYQGDASLQYRISLEQGGAAVATATCDPLGRINVKTTWVETDLGSSHARSGMGKMGCSVKLAKGGPTTVKATLAFARKPPTMSLKKADLVVKQ
jgi:hypothetical protein